MPTPTVVKPRADHAEDMHPVRSQVEREARSSMALEAILALIAEQSASPSGWDTIQRIARAALR